MENLFADINANKQPLSVSRAAEIGAVIMKYSLVTNGTLSPLFLLEMLKDGEVLTLTEQLGSATRVTNLAVRRTNGNTHLYFQEFNPLHESDANLTALQIAIGENDEQTPLAETRVGAFIQQALSSGASLNFKCEEFEVVE